MDSPVLSGHLWLPARFPHWVGQARVSIAARLRTDDRLHPFPGGLRRLDNARAQQRRGWTRSRILRADQTMHWLYILYATWHLLLSTPWLLM